MRRQPGRLAVRGGREQGRVQGVRRFTELIAEHPRLTATTVQTVGAKGYDGFTLALVTA